ncbi:hypothetical protein [Streptomyces sp. OE57]|uniref:hypothetical protein n=1 Tax=Streptomyces lacaronensis TaxID=3379885 RepID=UPI0039B73EF8
MTTDSGTGEIRVPLSLDRGLAGIGGLRPVIRNSDTTAIGWWTPPTEQPEAQRTGVWWDSVRVEAPLGDRILQLLGERTGAVICHYGALYWFVEPGAADSWETSHATVVRTTDRSVGYIAVPPKRFTEGPGVHWRVLPGDEYLTEAAVLREALRAAIPG